MRSLPFIFSTLEKIRPRLSGKFALNLFLTPLRYARPEREKKVYDSSKKSFIEVDGYKVAIYEWGEGPIIWMLHGWSGRATQLHAFIDRFVEKGYKIIGVDAPGHGDSSGKKSNVLLFGKALLKLNQIYGPPYAYIGHSLGGAIGFLALKNGIKFQKMVSISAPSIARAVIEESLKKLGATDITVRNMEKIFKERYHEPFENYTALKWVRFAPDIPILIIHDEGDKDAPFHHGEALSRELPNAEFYTTQGLGHMQILRDKKTVDKVVDFISE